MHCPAHRAACFVLGLVTPTGARLAAQAVPDLHRITGATSRTLTGFHQLSVPKGGGTIIAEMEGPGKVTYLYITDDTAGRWYPGLVLKVYWDDAKEPSIQLPLADSFGAVGGQAVDYQPALMQINHACFMCYLPMPFTRRAKFVLGDDGDEDYSRKVAFEVDFERSAVFAGQKSRLHCEWRQSNPMVNGLHTILEAGHGHMPAFKERIAPAFSIAR